MSQLHFRLPNRNELIWLNGNDEVEGRPPLLFSESKCSRNAIFVIDFHVTGTFIRIFASVSLVQSHRGLKLLLLHPILDPALHLTRSVISACISSLRKIHRSSISQSTMDNRAVAWDNANLENVFIRCISNVLGKVSLRLIFVSINREE